MNGHRSQTGWSNTVLFSEQFLAFWDTPSSTLCQITVDFFFLWKGGLWQSKLLEKQMVLAAFFCVWGVSIAMRKQVFTWQNFSTCTSISTFSPLLWVCWKLSMSPTIFGVFWRTQTVTLGKRCTTLLEFFLNLLLFRQPRLREGLQVAVQRQSLGFKSCFKSSLVSFWTAWPKEKSLSRSHSVVLQLQGKTEVTADEVPPKYLQYQATGIWFSLQAKLSAKASWKQFTSHWKNSFFLLISSVLNYFLF